MSWSVDVATERRDVNSSEVTEAVFGIVPVPYLGKIPRNRGARIAKLMVVAARRTVYTRLWQDEKCILAFLEPPQVKR